MPSHRAPPIKSPPQADAAISPARRVAFDVLLRVAAESAYASELLFTRITPQISRADAALATELTLGVLRQQRLLDFLLARHLEPPAERAFARFDLEVLIALRLGLYQLRFLERVPTHAAVGESVELVKRARKRSAAPLVNAVLRKAAKDARMPLEDVAALLPQKASPAERAATLHSHPTWLVQRWIAAFGAERTIALLEANNRPPRLSAVVFDETVVDAAADSFQQEKLTVTAGRWLRAALTLSGGNPAVAAAFRAGKISIQDEASQMVARLLDAKPGNSVLDVCSAPGGKTALLARAIGPTGTAVAADLHEHRLRAVREQLTRTGTNNVALVAADACSPLPFHGPFDRILVDAPCTGTGTLARNPEIRWRLEPDDLARAHRQQVAMLQNAVALLAPDGRLVYSTCSLEPEENEQVLTEALAERPEIRNVSGEAALSPHLRSDADASSLFDRGGMFHTFPPETHTDGFFAAVLERRA